jgi:hypothetical protein
MRPGVFWLSFKCEAWSRDFNHFFSLGEHFITLRKLKDKDGQVGISEKCEKCQVGRWFVK